MNRSSIPWTAKQISRMVDNHSLSFDNAIQRNFVWDKNRMSLLIDSMLRNYPIPAFYAIKTENTVSTPKGDIKIFDCLDGKQRCTTINKFKHNQFELTGLDTILTDDGELDINGMTYDDLPEELQDAFDSYSLTVHGFTEVTDEDVVEIMRRLNNGKPLSVIDLTRINAKDLAGLNELGKHPLFSTCLTEKARNGHQCEDIIIKVWAQLQDYKKSLDNKNVRKYYETLEVTPDIHDRLSKIFDTVLKLYNKFVDVGNKATARKIITKTHLISLSYVIDKMVQDGLSDEDIFIFTDQFFTEGKPSCREEYNRACKNGSNHAANVVIRIESLMKEYEWYVQDEDECPELKCV